MALVNRTIFGLETINLHILYKKKYILITYYKCIGILNNL